MAKKEEETTTKRIEREIQDWEAKYRDLQAGLEKAKEGKARAEAARAEIVLLAKTGNRKAADELEKLTTAWLKAAAEVGDYEMALHQCEEKILDLKKARLQAERREKEDKLKQMTLELMKTTDAFDRALAEFIIPLVEASRQVYELSALTAELGVHQHVVLKMRQLIGNVLLDRLALFNLPDFGRAQPALRDKTLSELLRQLFRQILEPEESTPRELPEPPQEKKPEAAEEPADEDILEIPAGFSLLEEATT